MKSLSDGQKKAPETFFMRTEIVLPFFYFSDWDFISEKVSECIRSRKRPTSGYFSFNFKGRKMQFSA